MVSVESARELAEKQLAAALPRRWRHVQAVAHRAEEIAPVVGEDADLLRVAAWLHDVGYGPAVVDTQFHPLDGARWLRRAGVDTRVAALVANHSCALLEADERGLADALLSEFPPEESETSDALWYCDMTTGPDGQTMSASDRIAEIKDRYGPGEVVTRFITRAEPEILAAVRRTEDRLRGAAGQPM